MASYCHLHEIYFKKIIFPILFQENCFYKKNFDLIFIFDIFFPFISLKNWNSIELCKHNINNNSENETIGQVLWKSISSFCEDYIT